MNLSVSEIKKLLKNWYFYKAFSLSSQDGGVLAKQINAVERAINALEECDAVIVKMKYFERTEMEILTAHFFISRQAIYKRLETILKRISFCIAKGGQNG